MTVWRADTPLRRAAASGCGFLATTGVLVGTALAQNLAGLQPDHTAEELGSLVDAKLMTIVQHAETSAAGPRLTPLLESEINAYLRFQGAPHLPVGMTDPRVRIGESQRVTAEATIDLDAIREQRSRGPLDLLRYLGGQLSVSASGTVSSGNGVARVDIEAVTIAGVDVPVQVLQELVHFYTRTESQPDGTRLDEPIALPYGITELRITQGRAVVVQ